MRPYVYFLLGSILAVAIVGAATHKDTNRGPRTEDRGPQPDLIIPVDGVTAEHLKSNFNDHRGAFRIHHAIDILAPRGTVVRAAVDGTLRKLFTSSAGGLTIYEFDRDETRCYYYAHLDRYAYGVHEGMKLKQGDIIGYVGTTGNAPANTPHLHFAISVLTPSKEWWKGTPIDPYPLLVQAGGATAHASTIH